ncbi:MAG: Fe-S oxidoreductase, partial [Planctomycetes bacterium]|nr:Fe-S oxidoreductase [Planctomycetota bacterium]
MLAQLDTPTRAIFHNLAPWMQVVFYIAGGLACAVFAWGFWRRIRKYRRGRAEPRFDRLGARLGRACVTILGNTTVRRGDALGGWA